MINSMWVTLLARQSHEFMSTLWPTECMWLFSSLSVASTSHNQQNVSDMALNKHSFAKQSHESCLTQWPTVCEWYCFISLPGTLINHVLSHNQQEVSGTTLFLCQAVSSIMSIPWPTGSEWHCLSSLPKNLINYVHPMTNSMWVTLLYFFAREIMSHPMTNREWVALLYFFPSSLINHVSFHDQQFVSNATLFLCQAVSSIISQPITACE